VALAPVGGGSGEAAAYIPISTQRTARVNNDGTLTPIVNITAQSQTYGVQFTFTLTAATFDLDGGPPLTSQRTAQVDAICAYRHVQGFYTEQDTGPDLILYNFAVIVVGTDDGAITNEARVRMDHLDESHTYALIDQAWAKLAALGAT
jgi:hypothetical protein